MKTETKIRFQTVTLTASLILFLVLLSPAAHCQIRAGCTADSMPVALAGSIAARELGRWTCYAQNVGTTELVLSRAGFALDFLELRQLDYADVIDVFSQKQKMTKAAKVARAFELAGFAALVATGGSGVVLTAVEERAIGIGTYAATKGAEYFKAAIPSIANATSGLLTQDILLQPGQSAQWKVYASKFSGASQLGPKILTQPAVLNPNPAPSPELRRPTNFPRDIPQPRDRGAVSWIPSTQLYALNASF